MDLGLNGNYDIELNDRNDIPLVDGRRGFEMRVAVRVSAYFHRVIGDINQDNVLSLLELEAKRVADETEEIESLVEFEAEFSDDQPGQIRVDIFYQTGDLASFFVTE